MPKDTVFKVYPNGIDDTEALMQAFNDAKAAGPGAVVQLSEGLFKIGFLDEIFDFNGYFLGAGKDKTIVSNLLQPPFISSYNFLCGAFCFLPFSCFSYASF